jgi:hypothetical protein
MIELQLVKASLLVAFLCALGAVAGMALVVL